MNAQTNKIFILAMSSFMAEALVPINPKHWPAFYAGTVFYSESKDASRFIEPWYIPIVIAEFIASSKSDSQCRGRVFQCIDDTGIVNALCELDPTGTGIGPFLAAAYTKAALDSYTEQRVDTQLTLSDAEKLNEFIYRQVAKEQGRDPDEILGTGLFRENVPSSAKKALWNRPKYSKTRPQDMIFSNSEDGDEFNEPDLGPTNGPQGPIGDGANGNGTPLSDSNNFPDSNPDSGSIDWDNNDPSIFGNMETQQFDPTILPGGRVVNSFENHQQLANFQTLTPETLSTVEAETCLRTPCEQDSYVENVCGHNHSQTLEIGYNCNAGPLIMGESICPPCSMPMLDDLGQTQCSDSICSNVGLEELFSNCFSFSGTE